MPKLAWPLGDDRWVGIGPGDLLVASLGPLILRKAYGRPAGIVELAIIQLCERCSKVGQNSE